MSENYDTLKVHDNLYNINAWQRLNPASGKYANCYAVSPRGRDILEGQEGDYLIESLFSEQLKYGHYGC